MKMSAPSQDQVEPQVALSRFLTAIKNQADMDPSFRNNLLLALGVTIVFEGENDLSSVEPHIVAARKDELSFRAIYSKLTGPKLRSLITKAKLASATDLRGKSPEEMMTMLWERARGRAQERGLVE
jgi:hypothetical protein